ncbi:hypothetical protein U9M48_028869 [Paspalum notatum var. saurae]|uniref:Uncharacterized protein n=1 Tax=Paspalum notatum var. saurae TaxID=547442 RepID=A0AAQ3TXM1_PASNO
MDALQQTGTVAEYQEQFEKLAHGILLYNPAFDDVYFVTRFLGGLKESIRAPIALHRPQNVDTASALALLQEEELAQAKSKAVFRGSTDKLKTVHRKDEGVPSQRSVSDDKFAALKAFRKANGLCFKCGGKWGLNHACPKQIPLHVVEELLEVFQLGETSTSDPGEEEDPTEEVVLSVTSPPHVGSTRKTMKLLGHIGKHQVLILVDSGSVGTFISEQLVSRLKLATEPCDNAVFKAADGGLMQCTQKVSGVQWFVQGHTSTSDARVLPLKCFDMILGEDWLEEMSPMWVDWRQKLMRFDYQGKRVALQGVHENLKQCLPIAARKVKGLLRRDAITHCVQWSPHLLPDSGFLDNELCSISTVEASEIPAPVQQLLNEYDHLFATPTALHPRRPADHSIPLMPDAQPVKSLMNQIFASLLRKGVLVFNDDILKQVEYLGHVISAAGVATDPSKIAAVLNWPTPTTVKELQEFLGLTGYYRKFIQHYAMVSRPLTLLLKKGVPFVWTPETAEAFQLLQQKLVTAPVLALPDLSKPFVLETDACNIGVGAVLMQEGHPVAFMSKPLGIRNQALSVYEKECLAILLAVDKWRPYLQHRPFVIRTDHRSLLHLTEQRVTSRLQHKALIKLMDLQFSIQYKKGITNAAADALSRCPLQQEVSSVSESIPSWIQKLKEGYADDAAAQQLLTELSVDPQHDKGFSLDQGVLRYKGRVWVGNNSLAQQHILQALHDNGLGGHSGITATYHRIKQLFAWPHLKRTVTEFVQACTVCQQAKTEHVKLPSLLQPLPVPTQAWEVVSMDFIEGLPSSDRYNAILMVIDKFTKYGHFVPLVHPFTALKVAEVYMSQQVSPDLSSVCTDPLQPLVPERILQQRLFPKGTSMISLVLVQWSSLPPEMSTWEEEQDVRRRFPTSPASGQAGIQERGNVTV